jgi:leader peptidase (prepilin peptidase)/N-methyltransferase
VGLDQRRSPSARSPSTRRGAQRHALNAFADSLCRRTLPAMSGVTPATIGSFLQSGRVGGRDRARAASVWRSGSSSVLSWPPSCCAGPKDGRRFGAARPATAAGRRLRAAELVPILSWVAEGRCRICARPIAPEHLGHELAAALVGAVALLAHPGLAGAVTALLGWWLLLIAALDAKHHWLPDRLTLPLIPRRAGRRLAGIGPDWRSGRSGRLRAISCWPCRARYRKLAGGKGWAAAIPSCSPAWARGSAGNRLPLVLLGAGCWACGGPAAASAGRAGPRHRPAPLGHLMAHCRLAALAAAGRPSHK